MNTSSNFIPMSANRATSTPTTGVKPIRGKRSARVRVRQATRAAERALKYGGAR